MERVVIVGASAAGITAAATLRRLGYTGEVVMIGAETALPYDRPPLSKRVLSGEWQPDETTLRSPDELDSLDLDLRLGTLAEGLDVEQQRVRLSDGSTAAYDAVVIATGVTPRQPLGVGLAGVHHLRTVEDAVGLRDRLGPGRRLVIVGAGLIGMEVAAVARGLGAEVSVVEPDPAPLVGTLGSVAGHFLADLHRANGVVLHTGVSAVALLDTAGRVSGVALDDGRRLPADEVLVAVGTAPNTQWLTGSGLQIDDGIVCDEFCRAAPGVYAAGDVARWHNPLFGVSMRIEHRTNAGEQAMAVARNLLRPAEEQVPFAPVPYFWTDHFSAKVQSHGYLRGHDKEGLVHGDPATGRFLVSFHSGDRLTGVVSVGVPPRELRPWRAELAKTRVPLEQG